jgi:hypothetical protein
MNSLPDNSLGIDDTAIAMIANRLRAVVAHTR